MNSQTAPVTLLSATSLKRLLKQSFKEGDKVRENSTPITQCQHYSDTAEWGGVIFKGFDKKMEEIDFLREDLILPGRTMI